MKRKWTNMKKLSPIIIKMRNEGYTLQQIADALDLEKIQIKNWVKRFNHQKNALPKVPSRRGRSQTRPISTPEALALRIQELEREVELYRAFLQAAGRM
jgi:transposase-like protein